MDFLIETLGCKLNQYESQAIAQAFKAAGYRQTDGLAAGLAILNSCAVTGKSEQKTRRLSRLLAKNCDAVIVCGCAAAPSAARLQKEAGNIIFAKGSAKAVLLEAPNALKGLSGRQLVERAQALLAQKRNGGANPFGFEAASPAGRTRASLKIQDGCDRSCTYCYTRIARGRAVSLDAGEIVNRLNRLAAAGHKEITLTGINLAAYSSGGLDLWGLLLKIYDETQGFRLRLTSLEPDAVRGFQALAALRHPRMSPHFHLAIQHGDDAVLQAMERPYSRQQVIEAVQLLREAKENPFLACDIIAGFPGEDEAAFAQSRSLLRMIDISCAHVFAFSPRPGTKAFAMGPKTPERVRDSRVADLRAFSELALARYAQSQEGLIREALAESEVRPDGAVRCRTDNYLDVWLYGAPEGLRPGRLVQVCLQAGFKARFAGWA